MVCLDLIVLACNGLPAITYNALRAPSGAVLPKTLLTRLPLHELVTMSERLIVLQMTKFYASVAVECQAKHRRVRPPREILQLRIVSLEEITLRLVGFDLDNADIDSLDRQVK